MHRTHLPEYAPVGVGLKAAYMAQVLAAIPVDLGFFEVHAENYMGAGGPGFRQLEKVRARHDLSIHGVGLSIGGEGPLAADHLQRLKTLVKRFEPRWFSEHLAWSSHGGHYYNDLLPLPYDSSTLDRVCEHIDQVQTLLQRRMLLENPATYVEFDASTMDEATFLREVLRRTGCGLLLDVNNVYVSAVNHGRNAQAFIDALPADAVGEIHLAGFAEDHDAAGARLLIDTHGAAVDAQVWALYAHALRRTGPVPTMIERDQNIPSFEHLQAEAHRARAAMQGLHQPSTQELTA